MRLVLVTQYFTTALRQAEIDECLVRNLQNPCVDQVLLLNEVEYALDFLTSLERKKLHQVVIGCRLTFQEAFNYYNDHLSGDICLLANADIFTDESLSLLFQVDFGGVVLALNRYEIRSDRQLAVLNGMETDYRSQSPQLGLYQPQIWCQDAWIWCSPHMEVKGADFALGMNGCDNYLAYLLHEQGQRVINPSHLITISHLDTTSHRISEQGLQTFKNSHNRASVTDGQSKYIYLDNIDDLPDRYTTLITEHDQRQEPFNAQDSFVKYTLLKKIVQPIRWDQQESQLSSQTDHGAGAGTDGYGSFHHHFTPVLWDPLTTDTDPWIQFDLDHDYRLAILDVTGPTYQGTSTRPHQQVGQGLLNALKIEIFDDDQKCWQPVEDTQLQWYPHKQLLHGNQIERVYFKEPLMARSLRIHVNVLVPLRFRFYHQPKLDVPYCRDSVISYLGEHRVSHHPVEGTQFWQCHIGHQLCLYYDHDWEEPNATEKRIFQLFLEKGNLPKDYFAFPWAAYVDIYKGKAYERSHQALKQLIEKRKDLFYKRQFFTIIQHEAFVKFFEVFKQLNIKYIFASQLESNYNRLMLQHEIYLTGFPLYPAQAYRGEIHDLKPLQNRRYLASFMGFYDHFYISKIRMRIFEEMTQYKDCLIVRRQKWAYQHIYEQSLKPPEQEFQEYREAIAESQFTLCPSGSGPNSIRIWEALSYGSIPVILADTYILPEIPDQWNRYVVLWDESQIADLYHYLVQMPLEKKQAMSQACLLLYQQHFSPQTMHLGINQWFQTVKMT